MTDKRWKALTVPYDIVAADDSEPQCYRLSGKTVRMLLAMIQYMEWRTRWHKNDGSELSLTEIDNVQAWAAQGAYELMTPEPCADESCAEGDCVAYYPTNSRFSYAPNNPFVQCEVSPAGYLTCPLVSGLSSGIPGALPDDIYCTIPTLLPAPPLGLIDQILNSGFPRVHMEFSGSGEIEVHLLEVAQGGLAIVRVDDVAYVNVVDLQGISIADIAVSLDFVISVVTGLLDWRFINEKIIEFSVPAGDHTLDILFIPNLSLNILETGWGGGLRSVVLCGDFTPVDCPDSIIDPIGGGGGAVAGMFDLCWYINIDGVQTLRYTINGGCTWNDVGVCGDSLGTVGPPIVIDPIDRPGEIPDPDTTIEDLRCRVSHSISWWFLSLRVLDFINNVLSVVSASQLGNAVLVWLDATTEDMPSSEYMTYYPKFKALAEKYYASHTTLEEQKDDYDFDPHMLCIVHACIDDSGVVNRERLNCITAGIEADTSFWNTHSELAEFFVDYINALPLSVVRERTFRDASGDVEIDCSSCEEEPAVSCDIELLCDFRSEAGLNGFGFITGAASDWNFGEVNFGSAQLMVGELSSLYGFVSQTQSSNPSAQRAMAVQKIFAEPYDLCQLHIVTSTYTERGNTRQLVVWVRDYVSAGWYGIASRKIPIYTGGHIEIFAPLPATAKIDGMVIAGMVGGDKMRITIAHLNYLIVGA